MQRQRGTAWTPKVKYRPDRNCWMVDCGFAMGATNPDGLPKRIRQMFPTEAEAETWAGEQKQLHDARLREQHKARKADAVTAFYAALTAAQRQQIMQAMSMADNDATRIIRAVDFYHRHNKGAEASRLLADVYADYVASKRQSGKRPGTVKDIQVKLGAFVNDHGNAKMSELTTGDVERWLKDRNFSPTTFNAYRAAIVALFNYAVRRQYLERNPAEIIDVVTKDQGLPAIHTVDQVRSVLYAARDYVPEHYSVKKRGKGRSVKQGKLVPVTDAATIHEARAKIVPYLAIGYLAGLRPQNELANLDWKNIHFEARQIRVDPATAKKRRQRYVDMSDNLVRWLAPYVRQSGKIGFSRFTLRAVLAKSGVSWSKDVMRHCFGSYLVATNDDPVKVAAQMGHTRTSELFKSYRNLVKKSDATKYWQIVPDEKAEIIQMPVVRAG